METFLTTLAPYGVLMIFVATFFDTFFITGYFLFGFALMSSVGVLHATGLVGVWEIFIAAYLGTTSASLANFFIGRFFGHYKFIADKLVPIKTKISESRLDLKRIYLIMTLGRCLAFTRPVYLLLLGTIQAPKRQVIWFEFILAAIWTAFWIAVLLLGEAMIMELI